MTDAPRRFSRRSVLQMGAVAATLPLFNVNHAWSQDVAFDGKAFDAGGAVLRLGEWGGSWGDLVQKHLIRAFEKEFNWHRYFNLSKFAILSMMLILCGFQASDFTPHICGCLTQLAMVC